MNKTIKINKKIFLVLFNFSWIAPRISPSYLALLMIKKKSKGKSLMYDLISIFPLTYSTALMLRMEFFCESITINTYVIPFLAAYFKNGLTICLFILPSDIIIHSWRDYPLASAAWIFSNSLRELAMNEDIDKSWLLDDSYWKQKF